MMEWRGRGGANPQAGAVTLLDILDKVLDKGLVVAGDIRVSLASVELLTIKLRLLVCSIDKAEAIGLDWWRRDTFLSSGAAEVEAMDALRARVEELERRLAAGEDSTSRTAEPGAADRGER